MQFITYSAGLCWRCTIGFNGILFSFGTERMKWCLPTHIEQALPKYCQQKEKKTVALQLGPTSDN